MENTSTNPEIKVNILGHDYDLANMDSGYQNLKFIMKVGAKDSGKIETIQDGVTNETTLKMLIDRMKFLDSKLPHLHNKAAINHLKWALDSLNRRTEERKERGVEGTGNR